MGTIAYGGKGSKGRAVNGDRPMGAADCRREQHTRSLDYAEPRHGKLPGWLAWWPLFHSLTKALCSRD